MKWHDYFKSKIWFTVIQLIIVSYVSMVLMIYHVDISIILFSTILLVLLTFAYLIVEFRQKKMAYKEYFEILNDLEKKYYMNDISMENSGYEFEMLEKATRLISDSILHELNDTRKSNLDYIDYIDLWVHEIKLPITSIMLIADNNRNDVTSRISSEAYKIDSLIEQVLYFSKSSNLEKDYFIQEYSLSEIVVEVLKENAKKLIEVDANIVMDIGDDIIYTDKKWIKFILNQIIDNSIKYKNKKLKIEFKSYERENRINLQIIDNGIGISRSDLTKVFLKGYTGKNGRKIKRSTGFGLYICKKLCDKLSVGIQIDSTEDIGTRLDIVFPKDGRILLK